MTPICPSCKNELNTVMPVRLGADNDFRRRSEPTPIGVGFACRNCRALLPLMPETPSDGRR